MKHTCMMAQFSEVCDLLKLLENANQHPTITLKSGNFFISD